MRGASPFFQAEQKVKRLRSKMLKLSDGASWEAYVCDDRLFTQRSAVIERARTLAGIRNGGEWINKTMVSCSLPIQPLASFGAADPPIELKELERTAIYYVGSDPQPHSDLDEAIAVLKGPRIKMAKKFGYEWATLKCQKLSC